MKTNNDLQYKQIDFKSFKAEFLAEVKKIESSNDFKNIKSSINNINKKRNDWDTNWVLAEIHNFAYQNDTTAQETIHYYDGLNTNYTLLINQFYKAIAESKYIEQIKDLYGHQIINIAKNNIKLFGENIKKLQEKELELQKQFGEIYYQIQFEINGKTYSNDSIQPLLVSADRALRKEAISAQSSAYQKAEDSLAPIIIKLIKVRNEIAQKRGFDNYISYRYLEMGRFDYGMADIITHRKAIEQYWVPFTKEIRAKHASNIGQSSLKFHDYNYFGIGDHLKFNFKEHTIKELSNMFGTLSKSGGYLFDRMVKEGFIDYEIREEKMPGNHAFYIPNKKMPYLHTNFGGTKEDFSLLTHEFGHAFGYLQSDTDIPEYVYPEIEGAEIQSIAMEFICYSGADRFFGQQGDEYRYWHLAFFTLYLSHLTILDEFEHSLYEIEPENAEDLRNCWKAVELKYLPSIDYQDASFFKNGGRYLAASNWLVDYPFYSICYSLAQFSALQIWKEYKQNPVKGWEAYMNFCKLGGRESFLTSLNKCNIKSPFELKNIKEIMEMVSLDLNELELNIKQRKNSESVSNP